MLISLHKQAATTPKIRAAIQASTKPAWMVAERYGISEQTVWKWRKRDSTHDRSHTPHRLQTTLTQAQEAVAVALRKSLLLPLDDLLSVVREFLNPNVSRSGLDRCLRRHGVGNLRHLKPAAPRPAHKPFKAYAPGYLHIDVKYLPQMADEDRRRYLFVAIDRATRWVFVRVYPAKTAANARRVMTGVDRQGIAVRAATIAAGRHRSPPEAHELAAIRYREVGDAASLIALFDALEAAQGARTFRPEILHACIKALRLSRPHVSFLEAAKRIREQQRVLGRLLPTKAVGSPLLLKGLEGDVAVILDASDFDRDAAKNRKNLYVAMTRGSRKLVVCSPTHLLG